MQIRIRQWDPSTLKDGRIVLLVGRRGGGKSTLMTSILHALRDRLEFAVAMTPTEDSMDMFRKHMPESWIHSGFAGTQLEDMMKAQRRCARERKATGSSSCCRGEWSCRPRAQSGKRMSAPRALKQGCAGA